MRQPRYIKGTQPAMDHHLESFPHREVKKDESPVGIKSTFRPIFNRVSFKSFSVSHGSNELSSLSSSAARIPLNAKYVITAPKVLSPKDSKVCLVPLHGTFSVSSENRWVEVSLQDPVSGNVLIKNREPLSRKILSKPA